MEPMKPMKPMSGMTPMEPMSPMDFGPAWWPETFGQPSTSGGPSPAAGGTQTPAGSGVQTPTTPAGQPTTVPPVQPPPPDLLTVPDVVGLGEGPAVSEINSAGFVAQVGYQYRRNSCSVLEQTPAGNSQAQAGTYVYLTVAMGDTIQKSESALLDWLAREWSVQVQFDPAAGGG